MANNENSSASYMTRRIGGTTYKVRVCFSETAQETLEDKILRMIRNETVTNAGTCDIMKNHTPLHYEWNPKTMRTEHETDFSFGG